MTTPAGGTNAGTLTVRIVSDASGLARDVTSQVDGAAGAAAASGSKAAKTVGERIHKVGTQASIGLTLPMLALGKHALEVASDTVEATNKVGVVFGNSKGVVEAFAASAAKSIGVSRREALAGASAFGALFTTMGIGPEKAAGLSTSLVKLGADMASFSNSSPQEALDALQSGLNGESEPLRRFGVFLSDARVQAEALATGLVKPVANAAKVKDAATGLQIASRNMAAAVKAHGAESTQALAAQRALTKAQDTYTAAAKGSVPALTEAQKAQARYSVIMRDTKQAQGDVARSAKTSAAVQASFAKAARDDAAGALGKSLIPLSITASQAITKLANGFSALPGPVQKGTLAVGAGLAMLGPGIKVYENVAKVHGGITKALQSERAAQLASRAGTIAGTIAGKLWVGVLKAQQIALRAAELASKAFAIGARLAGVALRFAMGPVGLVIIGITALVAGFILAYKHSETFRNIVNGALHGVAVAFHAFLGAVQATFGWIKDHWKLLLAIITGPIGAAVIFVVSHFGQIKAVVASVFGWVQSKVAAVGHVISGVASSIGGAFQSAFGLVQRVVSSITGAVRGVVNALIGGLHHLRIPGFSIGVGPISYHFGGLDPFGGIPFLAAGGVVPATAGGRLAVVGEGRHDEAVLPLDGSLGKRLGLSGGGVQIITHVHNPAPEPASESVNKRLRRLAALGIADAAAAGGRQLATAGA